jgi:tetratricopeptide (TPR) repeat protein
MALGLVLSNATNLPAAIEAFRHSLRVTPHHVNAELPLAQAKQFGKVVDALTIYVKALPKSADGHIARGESLDEKGRLPEANTELAEAEQLAPDDPQAETLLTAMQAEAQKAASTK